jgi:hypothetical protein
MTVVCTVYGGTLHTIPIRKPEEERPLGEAKGM